MNKNAPKNNFIVNFCNNVELLIAGHGEYLILLSKLPTKLKQNNSMTSEDSQISEELMTQLETANNNLKYLVHKTILQIKSLGEKEDIKHAEKPYNKLRSQEYLVEEDLEEYCLVLTSFMMNKLGDVDFGDVAGQLYN